MAREPETITQQKKTLRAEVRRSLDAVSDRRFAGSIAAAKAVSGLAAWRNATELLLFVGMESEIATEPLIESALSTGKPIFLPRISGRVMSFHSVGPEQWHPNRLIRHKYGMLEPLPEWPLWSPGEPKPPANDVSHGTTVPGDAALPGSTLIVCPGMAFDRSGNRLGHGGGFYDRFLASLGAGLRFRFTLIGLCYDFQLMDTVPAEPTDIRVDAVVTDKQVVAIWPAAVRAMREH